MRLVILFLFCFVGLTNATDSYAQSAKVTMNVRNQTVEDVLRANREANSNLVSSTTMLI